MKQNGALRNAPKWLGEAVKLGALETFSTRLVAPERRHIFWRDLVAETFPGMSADVPVGFRAELARWQLGRIGMARALSGKARLERRAMDGDRHVVLHLIRHGQLMLHQGQALAIAGAGDIIIADADKSYSIDISDRNDCLVVDMPVQMLGEFAGGREWHAQLLSGNDMQVRLLRNMIEGLWRDRDYLPVVDGQTDEVVASLARMAMQRGGSCAGPVEGGNNPILDYVRRNLTDPELGTARIADAMGLSPRAVQLAFARITTATPTGFITEMRLQRSAELLRCPDNASITEIAFDVGFSDSAYFSRCFRRRFELSPSQWRAQNRS